MLSYRHAFHAGNPADILKHSILIFCLDYLGRKAVPYLCVDTHAGAGFYPLNEGYALQNREWEGGLGRLPGLALSDAAVSSLVPSVSPALPSMLERLVTLVRAFKPGSAGSGQDIRTESNGRSGDEPRKAGGNPGVGEGPWYPGSPALIKALLRSQDKAVCFELHPADFTILAERLGFDRRFTLRREDGFAGLKSLLPPPSRRACIFIDPPYEVKEDYETLPCVLAEALKRFSTGIYIVWYPLLGNRDAFLPETLLGLYRGNRCRVELCTTPPADRGMYGSGLIIYNPPWTLKPALESALPVLAELLGRGQGAWDMRWENL